MSIYKELNDVNIDLSLYEEQPLTNLQQKQWQRRILKKVTKHKVHRSKKMAGAAAAVVFIAIGITMSTGTVTFANIPFVGGMIERFVGTNEQADYSPYKTEIGATAENKFGKWTLDEAMIDGGRFVISSTFEPAEGVKFNYQMNPWPTILMKGQNVTSGNITSGQSIKVHENMYTIYNEVNISNIPIGETIPFRIEYDNIDQELENKKLVDTPWVFDINVNTEQLAAIKETINFDQDIPIGNGQLIHLNEMIVTPISTILYYDWLGEANHIVFKIVTEDGVEILPNSSAVTADTQSYNRYVPLDLKTEKYYLVPYESSENRHAVNPGEVPDQAIPINP